MGERSSSPALGSDATIELGSLGRATVGGLVGVVRWLNEHWNRH